MERTEHYLPEAESTPLALPRELTLTESLLLNAIRLYEKYRLHKPMNALRRAHNLPEVNDPLAGYDEAVRKARAIGLGSDGQPRRS